MPSNSDVSVHASVFRRGRAFESNATSYRSGDSVPSYILMVPLGDTTLSRARKGGSSEAEAIEVTATATLRIRRPGCSLSLARQTRLKTSGLVARVDFTWTDLEPELNSK